MASWGGLVIGQHNAGRMESLKNSSEPPKSARGSETPQWRKTVRKPQSHRKRPESQPEASVLLSTVWCRSHGAHSLGEEEGRVWIKLRGLLLHWEGWSQSYYFSHRGLIGCSANADASSQCVGFPASRFLGEKKRFQMRNAANMAGHMRVT